VYDEYDRLNMNNEQNMGFTITKKISVTIEKRVRGSELSDEVASIGPGEGDD